MPPAFRKKRIPPELVDRLHIAAAAASEQVMEEHVRSAIEMVEEGAGRAPIERLIAAYARLHYLDDRETRMLRERVLANLGRSPSDVGTLAGPRSPFTRLYRRVKGRVQSELREWVEQHTARVELAVLDIHVHNALATLRVVGEKASATEAIDMYTDMMSLRSTVAEMVRLRVLKTLNDRESGKVEGIRPGSTGPIPLRVAENDR